MSQACVIISAYNNAPSLKLALQGYLRQTSNNFRLIIADDGSRKDLLEAITPLIQQAAKMGLMWDHVWHEDQGFRKNIILNKAVRHCAENNLLIFTDGDCIPPATFVETHLEQHCERSFHVAGAYRLTQVESENISATEIDRGLFESLRARDQVKDLRRRWRKSHWGTLFRKKHRPKILGLNMAFDRALFEEINGFDERFVGWGLGEDSDVRDRVMKLRPRPVVRNLYGINDVFHLWHPVPPSIPRKELQTWEYYNQKRPVRCEQGLSNPELTS